jgi:hypothetical protein
MSVLNEKRNDHKQLVQEVREENHNQKVNMREAAEDCIGTLEKLMALKSTEGEVQVSSGTNIFPRHKRSE